VWRPLLLTGRAIRPAICYSDGYGMDGKLCDRFFPSAFRDAPDLLAFQADNASAVSGYVCMLGRYAPALRDEHPPEIDSDLAGRTSGAPNEWLGTTVVLFAVDEAG
jgi:hypothetical protein